MACCAVLLTFSGSNNDKVFTGQIATIFMIKYSCVLAEVLVQWFGLERSSIQTCLVVKLKSFRGESLQFRMKRKPPSS